MDSESWNRVTNTKLVAFAIVLGIFFLLLFQCEPGFVFMVDHANLLFHEAGHPVVGIFSSRLEPYGGTLGQLTFPVVLAISFWRKRETLSFAGSVIWLFENWLNIARYMADARAQVLPLVGGGEHDWFNIFARWRVLGYDTQIAHVVKTVGWVGMVVPSLWVVWLWWRRRTEVESAPDFDFVAK